MVTVESLTAGQPIPAPMEVGVRKVHWEAGPSRRAEVALTDIAGNALRLIDYEGANLSIEWTVGHRYRISRCRVNVGRETEYVLAPSGTTRVESLGPVANATRLLVLGDTHVGRTEHPKTGAKINPLGAFATAVEYGIERDVDAVVHTGDIFHETATISKRHEVQYHILDPLADAQVPFYYVKGNHGSTHRESLFAPRDSPGTPLNTTGVAVSDTVRLFGIDHHPDGNIPWWKLDFPRSIDESVSIIVLHQTIEQLSGSDFASVDIHRIERAANTKFDLVFAGHHHDALSSVSDGVPIQYTGAAERMSTTKDPIDRVAWIVTNWDETVITDRYDIP